LRQQAAGADLAHLKPPHVNPSDSILEDLVKGVEAVPAAVEPEHEPEVVKSR
jgi:hypothetical protein